MSAPPADNRLDFVADLVAEVAGEVSGLGYRNRCPAARVTADLPGLSSAS